MYYTIKARAAAAASATRRARRGAGAALLSIPEACAVAGRGSHARSSVLRLRISSYWQHWQRWYSQKAVAATVFQQVLAGCASEWHCWRAPRAQVFVVLVGVFLTLGNMFVVLDFPFSSCGYTRAPGTPYFSRPSGITGRRQSGQSPSSVCTVATAHD